MPIIENENIPPNTNKPVMSRSISDISKSSSDPYSSVSEEGVKDAFSRFSTTSGISSRSYSPGSYLNMTRSISWYLQWKERQKLRNFDSLLNKISNTIDKRKLRKCFKKLKHSANIKSLPKETTASTTITTTALPTNNGEDNPPIKKKKKKIHHIRHHKKFHSPLKLRTSLQSISPLKKKKTQVPLSPQPFTSLSLKQNVKPNQSSPSRVCDNFSLIIMNNKNRKEDNKVNESNDSSIDSINILNEIKNNKKNNTKKPMIENIEDKSLILQHSPNNHNKLKEVLKTMGKRYNQISSLLSSIDLSNRYYTSYKPCPACDKKIMPDNKNDVKKKRKILLKSQSNNGDNNVSKKKIESFNDSDSSFYRNSKDNGGTTTINITYNNDNNNEEEKEEEKEDKNDDKVDEDDVEIYDPAEIENEKKAYVYYRFTTQWKYLIAWRDVPYKKTIKRIFYKWHNYTQKQQLLKQLYYHQINEYMNKTKRIYFYNWRKSYIINEYNKHRLDKRLKYYFHCWYNVINDYDKHGLYRKAIKYSKKQTKRRAIKELITYTVNKVRNRINILNSYKFFINRYFEAWKIYYLERKVKKEKMISVIQKEKKKAKLEIIFDKWREEVNTMKKYRKCQVEIRNVILKWKEKRYLEYWLSFKNISKRYKELNYLAINHNNKIMKKKYFKLFKNHAKYMLLQDQASDRSRYYYLTKLLRKVMIEWNLISHKLNILNERGERFNTKHNQALVKHILDYWRNSTVTEHHTQIVAQHVDTIYKNEFTHKILMNWHQASQKMRILRRKKKTIMNERRWKYIQIWYKELLYKRKYNEIYSIHCKNIKKIWLKEWRENVKIIKQNKDKEHQAINCYNTILKQRYYKIWKYNYIEKQKENHMKHTAQLFRMSNYIQRWIEYTNKSKQYKEKYGKIPIKEFYEEYTIKRYLSKWNNYAKKSIEKKEGMEEFYMKYERKKLMKLIDRLRNGMLKRRKNNENMNKAIEFSDLKIIKKYLQLFIEYKNHEKEIKEKCEELLIEYNNKIKSENFNYMKDYYKLCIYNHNKNIKTLHICMNKWQLYHQYKTEERQIYQHCDRLYNNNLIFKCFNSFKQNVVDNKNYRMAVEYYEINMKSTFFKKWKLGIQYLILEKYHKVKIKNIYTKQLHRMILREWRNYKLYRDKQRQLFLTLYPIFQRITMYYYWMKYKEYIKYRNQKKEYFNELDKIGDINLQRRAIYQLKYITDYNKEMRERYKEFKVYRINNQLKLYYEKWKEENDVIEMKNKLSKLRCNVLQYKKYINRFIYSYMTKEERQRYILNKWKNWIMRKKNKYYYERKYIKYWKKKCLLKVFNNWKEYTTKKSIRESKNRKAFFHWRYKMIKLVFLSWKIYAAKGYNKRNKYKSMILSYPGMNNDGNNLDDKIKNDLSDLQYKSNIFNKWKNISFGSYK